MRVLIAGGGLTGAAVALELARSGDEVTVLEPGEPPPASGRLAPQVMASGPGPFLELCLRSRGLFPAWARQLTEACGVDLGYLESGALALACTEAEVHALDATVAWQRAFGLRAELLTSAEARTLEPALGPKVLAAAHFPDDHRCDPVALARALTLAATRAGVRFRRGEASALHQTQGRARGVVLDGAHLEADLVVVTAGALAANTRPLPRPMIELEASLRLPLSGAGAALEPRGQGALVAGPSADAASVLVPALTQARVSSTWAASYPATPDGLPILEQSALPGLLLACGHFTNEILLAPITARVIGQLRRHEKPMVELRPFRSSRFSP